MTDSYLEVPFPYETKFAIKSPMSIRLLGVIGNKVIGATYRKGGEKEYISQSLIWDADGMYSNGEYPTMNLMPLPSKINAQIEKLQDERAEAQARIDEFPDAPLFWREADEKQIARLSAQITHLIGKLPSEDAPDDAQAN